MQADSQADSGKGKERGLSGHTQKCWDGFGHRFAPSFSGGRPEQQAESGVCAGRT